jgi:hypothetical protein
MMAALYRAAGRSGTCVRCQLATVLAVRPAFALAAVAGVTLVGVLPTHRRRGILPVRALGAAYLGGPG